jgi:hypothetical integral membrane protein (TIGR02206 family)
LADKFIVRDNDGECQIKFLYAPVRGAMEPSPFHAFNTQHLVTIGLIVCLCFLVARTARGMSFSSRKWLSRFLGFLLLSYAAVLYFQLAAAHALSWQDSLPLELCHLVLIACIVALFWPNQLITEITYFLGLGGVLQATLTPDLSRGFPSWDFVLFFWSHGTTLIAIVFLITAPKFKPRKGSVTRMMTVLNCYALAVGAMDAVFGWNYGYLCHKPGRASLLDYMGPWPWYLLSLEFVSFLIFLLLSLPWKRRRLA